MTELERRAAKALGGCRYLPGSFDKRFAGDMATLAQFKPDYELTENQRGCLWRLTWRYRRQIGDVEIVEIARQGGIPKPPPLFAGMK